MIIKRAICAGKILVRESSKKNCPMATVRPLTSLVKNIFGDEGGKPSFSPCLSVTSSIGESVSVTPGLLLFRGLLAPLDVALLEATVDTDRQIVRDLGKKCHISKGSKEREYSAGVGLTPVASSTTS